MDKVINHQSIDALDGVVYRCENGTLKTIPKKNFIMDLDAIPFPARDYMEEDWFKMIRLNGKSHGVKRVSWTLSFCNVPSMYAVYGTEHCWRGRSIANIVDEMEYLYKEHGVLIFSF